MKNTSGWFSSALLLLFIGLKLMNVIDWSWWWVMAPLWVPVLIAIAMVVIHFIIKK